MNIKSALLVFIFTIFSTFLVGCSEKWEYKVVPVLSEGHSRTDEGAGNFSSVNPSEAMLNKLGSEGWELSSSYLEMETAWMNFGKSEYVTGLQPNIRPQRVVLVFKRRL